MIFFAVNVIFFVVVAVVVIVLLKKNHEENEDDAAGPKIMTFNVFNNGTNGSAPSTLAHVHKRTTHAATDE